MSAYDALLFAVGGVLATAVLIGLIVRRRVRACVSFVSYLTAVAVGKALQLMWPERFWTWDFMRWSDALQVILRAAIAFEICYKVFRPLPEGSKRMRATLALVLMAMAIAFVVYPPQAANAFEGTIVLQQVSYGVAFLFVAFLLVTWHYGIPIDPLHRDIACGFGLLSLVLSFAAALSAYDPAAEWGRYFLVKTAYPLLLAAWCVSAWRRDPPTRLSPRTMRFLQPWRLR